MGSQLRIETSSRAIFFSVVIPASNAATYIAQTLESVLRQSYSHFEVLVVDDGSRDATRSIVERYAACDPRVRLIALSEASGGPSRPRNAGIRESRGDYVALLDADDLWGPDKLLHDAEFLRFRPADLLYSGAHYFRGEPHNVVHTVPSRRPGSMLLVKNYVPTLTICMSRNFCAHGPVFEEDPLLGIEDYYLVLRAYLAGSVICNRPGTDAYYRQDSSGSYYRRNDFGLVMRRHLYNLTKTAMAQRMALPKLYTLWIVLTLMFGAKKLLGRL
jgi:teichuronic acid biosynthesis glycosyltransferase TuaG